MKAELYQAQFEENEKRKEREEKEKRYFTYF